MVYGCLLNHLPAKMAPWTLKHIDGEEIKKQWFLSRNDKWWRGNYFIIHNWQFYNIV